MKKIDYSKANAIAGGTIKPEHVLVSLCGAFAVSALVVMIDRLIMQSHNEAPYSASWNKGYSEGKKIAPPPTICIEPATFAMGLTAGRELGHQEVAMRPSAPPMPFAVAVPIS